MSLYLVGLLAVITYRLLCVAAVLAPSGSEAVRRSLRMTAHSLEVLISRWALHDSTELVAITGAVTSEMAESCAEEHVARLARRTLLHEMEREG